MSDLRELHEAIAAATRTLQSLVALDAQVGKAADLIDRCLRAGNKLLVCGNGGSAADASHFATELVVRFTKDRRALPAIVLRGIAEFSPLQGTTIASMSFLPVRWRHSVSLAMCSFA